MNETDLRSRFPRASTEFYRLNSGLCSQGTKPTDLPALAGETRREKESDERVVLRYELHRVRLLDPDNAVGATKTITDCLREIGLLADDTEAHVKIEVDQVKVAHRNEQKTVVNIQYP